MDLAPHLKRVVDEAFARVAINPEIARGYGRHITREEVERRLGSAAARAWDDVQAARSTYFRAVEKHLDEEKG